jgi:hypothetical protein
MGFGHERLDVYNAAIDYVGWAYHFCEELKGHRHAKDQLLRASQAIPLNIAEGNGKATDGDRRRYFEIAAVLLSSAVPFRMCCKFAELSPRRRTSGAKRRWIASWRC